jgi:hypothetical protein
MNPLTRSLIEKAGYDNGFENVISVTDNSVILGSALHGTQIGILVENSKYIVGVCQSVVNGTNEFFRGLDSSSSNIDESNHLTNEYQLGLFLKRAYELSLALPNQALNSFEDDFRKELEKLSLDQQRNTEIFRMTRQRIGQQVFREALMTYWEGACSVTGLRMPAALKASHAKPWADCEDDIERLDVFNGFLLSANLDALFDKFLISFDQEGNIIISSKVDEDSKKKLGIDNTLKLRWITLMHEKYLKYHRNIFNKFEEALKA